MADIVIDRSDAQIKTGIEKIADVSSSASEIDNAVNNHITQTELDAVVLDSGNVTPEQAANILKIPTLATNIGLEDVNFERDLKNDYAYAEGVLEDSGNVLVGFGGLCSEFIPVDKNTVIEIVCTNNYSASKPNILGYDEDKVVISTLLSNGSLTAQAENPAVVSVPNNCSFIRISATAITYANTKSNIKIAKEDIFDEYLDTESGNFLGLNKEIAYLDGRAEVLIGEYGTGYVPVTVDDTITFRLNGYGSFSGVNLYDSSKVFIRTLFSNSRFHTVATYTFNSIDDSDVAFCVGTAFQNFDNLGFFTLESAKNELTKIKDKDNYISNFNKERSDVVYTPLTSDSTVTVTNDVTFLNFNTYPCYITPTTLNPVFPSYTKKFTFHRLKLIALQAGATEVKLRWFVDSDFRSDAKFFNLDDEFILWAEQIGNQHLTTDVGGVIFEVIDSFSFNLDERIYDSRLIQDMFLDSDKIFNSNFIYSDHSNESTSANRLKTNFAEGRLVCFGDSIYSHYGVPELAAKSLMMNITNLAVSSSIPQDNLNDTNLANIPSDATIITLCGGINGSSIDSGDITSRDRTTMQGCLNYAIDYVYTNHPLARVILITPSQHGATGTIPWTPIYRELSEYRGVPLCDIDRNAGITPDTNSATQIDVLHPNDEGKKRMAGVIVGTIRNLGY